MGSSTYSIKRPPLRRPARARIGRLAAGMSRARKTIVARPEVRITLGLRKMAVFVVVGEAVPKTVISSGFIPPP